ncbi:hypothetical protein [Ornithinibacillus californiensis]|uniref:hypothetical protein n=1 Tax=Ornithinibacillus californiensis TaxID=161536 RepID=UPI00064E0479|nr:hypothetical protein [Ornithinibacillus californiensis]
MDKFDQHIKKEVQGFLKQNIQMSQEEINNIHVSIQKRKPINFIYISAFSLFTVIMLILVIPLFQQPKEFSSAPFSFKSGIDKILPMLDEKGQDEEKLGTEKTPEEEPGSEDDEIKTEETEGEKEAIFIELLERYNNEIRGKSFELDFEDETELFTNSLGYRIIGYNSMEELTVEFSDFITAETVSKLFCLVGEKENRLYQIVSEHCRSEFYTDKPYSLEKINDNHYRISQTTVTIVDEFILTFEFSKTDNGWLITDWKRDRGINPLEKYQTLALFEQIVAEFNTMNKRFTIETTTTPLSNGEEGYRIEEVVTKSEFYNLFSDFMTTEAADIVWEEHLVEDASGLFLLPKRTKYSPYESIEYYSLTYFVDPEGTYQVSQWINTEEFQLNYEFQHIDGTWLITNWSVTE